MPVKIRPAYDLRRRIDLLKLEARLAGRRLSDSHRIKPSFFIIGAQKAGTTSLFDYLARHPQVMPPAVKEVHYFDLATHRGQGWYESHFPSTTEADQRAQSIGKQPITFDATPYYMFHPDVTGRLLAYNPGAKFIAVLRDPVARAWSHYWHERARSYERLEPLAALEAEQHRLSSPHETIGATAEERFAHQHYSYVARSEYDLQLDRWRAMTGPDQLLVIKSEDLFARPAEVLEKVAAFLDLSAFDPAGFRARNVGAYDGAPPEAIDWLSRRLTHSQQRLEAMLGPDFTWRGLSK